MPVVSFQIVLAREYLTPNELAVSMCVCQHWNAALRDESLWKGYTFRRWRLRNADLAMKTSGCRSYRELYMHFARKQALPFGRFSTKRQPVWGTGRDQGVDIWVTIAHRSDCRVRVHQGTAYIQIRLVIQNTRPQKVKVNLHDIRVQFKNGELRKCLPHTNEPSVGLIAMNGDECSRSESVLLLDFFEFAVITFNVASGDCEFEADFLESSRAIWVPIQFLNHSSKCSCSLVPGSLHHACIRATMVDEMVIWKHYKLVSSHFMVRNDHYSPRPNTIMSLCP